MILSHLDDEAPAGTLWWYTSLIGEHTTAFRVAVGVNGGTPSGIPFTWPVPSATAWPEALRHSVLDAILRGGSLSALSGGWAIGLFGAGADATELTAPGYTRDALTWDTVTDIAASGDPVAGVRSNSATEWVITLTDQDIRGVVLFDATSGAEVVRGPDGEIAGATGAPATFTLDTYSGGAVWALDGPYAPAAAALDALINGSSYTGPGSPYLGFLEAFTFTPTELTAAGYSRQAITFGAPSSGQVSNTAALHWYPTGHWPTSTWALWDAPTGGTLLWQGSDGSIAPMDAGDHLLIDIGAVKARLL